MDTNYIKLNKTNINTGNIRSKCIIISYPYIMNIFINIK